MNSYWFLCLFLFRQETITAIMNQFMLGKKRGQVLCDILDADKDGNPPHSEDYDESSPSLLDVIVSTNNKVWILMHEMF